MKKDDWPTFLKVAEIADIMRVSKMSVYRLIRTDELHGIKVGRSYRVSEAVLDEYLKYADVRIDDEG